jgi:hypothetical protein
MPRTIKMKKMSLLKGRCLFGGGGGLCLTFAISAKAVKSVDDFLGAGFMDSDADEDEVTFYFILFST